MPDVFVSHASKDRDRAESLAARVRQAGLTVFLDTVSLKPGDDWTQVIHKNLADCSILLLLATEHAIASPNVNQEIGMALAQKKRIISLVWGMKPENLPPWVAKYQALVLTDKTETQVNEQITHLLKDLADQKQQHELVVIAVLGLALLWLCSSK